ncbi:MAG TPA: amidase family protein [Gryllotalpicola sp.]
MNRAIDCLRAGSQLYELGATELAALYDARRLSPVEVAKDVLGRIDEVDDRVHAFFTVTRELALRDAHAAEHRMMHGERLGPLDGIPVSIKDLEPTAGIRTTFGSPATVEHVPEVDGAAAGRLRAGGAVLLGKTAAPDSGYKDTSDTLIFPEPANPWNLDRTPGGSSGGAAAAVAVGMGPLAHGSDGAGSIRIPSALCGVVGLKPTLGRVPVWPQPFYRDTVGHNGAIGRTVADVALMLDVLAGPDARDPMSLIGGPSGGFRACLDAPSPERLRILVSVDLGYGAVDPEIAAAVRRAAAETAGSHAWALEEGDPGWSDPGATQADWWSGEFAGIFADTLRDHPEWLQDDLKALVEKGIARRQGDFDYRRMRGALHDAQRALFERHDYLVTPTMPLTAWRRGTSPDGVAGRSFPQGAFGRNFLLFPFNLTGNPAITVPCGLSSEGLPIGVQIVGRLYDEVGVLAVAKAFEEVAGFPAGPIDPAV